MNSPYRPAKANRLFTMFSYGRDMERKIRVLKGWGKLRSGLRLLGAVLASGLAVPLAAQSVTTVVNTTEGAINGTTTCAAPLVRQFVVTSNFIIADVDIGVLATHTWRGDLQMTLVAPDGTRVQLTSGDTANISGDNFNVLLDDAGTQLVNTDGATRTHSTTAPPFQNRFRPRNSLSAFNGRNAIGTWRLEICDLFPTADNGTFRRAELNLTAAGNFADLSLTKQLIGSPPTAGGSVSWRLSVTNASSSTGTASGIVVRDTLPGNFTFTSASGSGTFTPGTGTWNVGALAPGEVAVMTITGSISASAGTTITNTAQIIASSLPDPDSTVNNDATSEDDYAVSNLVVQSGRAAGIPPQLVCPAGFSVFDWGAIAGWTPGSTDNTYAFASFGNMRFRLANDGVFLNLATFGGQSPTVSATNTGGLSPSEPGLTVIADQANLSGVVTITISLPRSFNGVQFTIFDVDFFANQFADRVEVVGGLGGNQVLPELTNGNANFVQGNVAIGDALSADNEPLGNLVVTFSNPVDTITIRYGNHTTAPTNPGQQGVSLHDLIVCNPFAALSVTKVSSLISDPVNLTSNPKAIPGALVEYLISVTNNGTAATDNNSVVVIDNGPADAKLCQIARAGGPIIFNDPGGSGLAYSFAALGSASDSLEFSDDGGASWSYVPAPDGQGCDASVTSFRVRPGGGLVAGRSFTLRARYIVE
ncbi:MAG: proprotein convertase, P [Alphaproteobacteria bacterium HGW-Alphaproteobacteria-14]|nr:MAG: proprotein convertase, P [Alphaproteobacteria bacterium HGW-Alphaproteobacteria-14]